MEASRHLLITSEQRCWSAVFQPRLPKDWDWGESVVLTPEEIRLFSAVTLSEPDPWRNGLLIISHLDHRGLDPEEFGRDLRSPVLRNRLEDVVAEIVAEAQDMSEYLHTFPGPYRLNGGAGSLEEVIALLEAIDVEDQLLLAGLGRLLQAMRLNTGRDGPEDCSLPLFVSMGAAFEYLRLHLSAERGCDQPMTEVFEYLRSTFPAGDEVVEYFEWMYEYRILAMHPANRFGEFWANPMMVGQIYHLKNSLMGLYRHILTGKIDPSE